MKKLLALLPLAALLFTSCNDDNPQPAPASVDDIRMHSFQLNYVKRGPNGQAPQLDNAVVEVFAAEPEYANGTYTLKPYELKASYTDASATGKIVDLPSVKTQANAPITTIKLVVSTSNAPTGGNLLDASLYLGSRQLLYVTHSASSAQLVNGRYVTSEEFQVPHN